MQSRSTIASIIPAKTKESVDHSSIIIHVNVLVKVILVNTDFISKKIIRHRIYSKVIASLAIFLMFIFAMCIIVMDILKYCFGIDPVAEDREYLRRKRQANKRKKPHIQRFVYINAPAKSLTNKTIV